MITNSRPGIPFRAGRVRFAQRSAEDRLVQGLVGKLKENLGRRVRVRWSHPGALVLASSPENRLHVLMTCMGLDPDQYSEADRRAVDPPIQVETATWSKAGRLDWWVRDGGSGAAGYAVRTAGNGGSELLIFVPRALTTPDSSLPFVAHCRPVAYRPPGAPTVLLRGWRRCLLLRTLSSSGSKRSLNCCHRHMP
jgi:hypothetical protein